jgi:hypothetical protein
MTEDRWEAFGDYDDDRKFNEGVMTERERIVTLLEAIIDECNWEEVSKDTGYDDGPCEMCEETRINIALIKGEN